MGHAPQHQVIFSTKSSLNHSSMPKRKATDSASPKKKLVRESVSDEEITLREEDATTTDDEEVERTAVSMIVQDEDDCNTVEEEENNARDDDDDAAFLQSIDAIGDDNESRAYDPDYKPDMDDIDVNESDELLDKEEAKNKVCPYEHIANMCKPQGATIGYTKKIMKGKYNITRAFTRKVDPDQKDRYIFGEVNWSLGLSDGRHPPHARGSKKEYNSRSAWSKAMGLMPYVSNENHQALVTKEGDRVHNFKVTVGIPSDSITGGALLRYHKIVESHICENGERFWPDEAAFHTPEGCREKLYGQRSADNTKWMAKPSGYLAVSTNQGVVYLEFRVRVSYTSEELQRGESYLAEKKPLGIVIVPKGISSDPSKAFEEDEHGNIIWERARVNEIPKGSKVYVAKMSDKDIHVAKNVANQKIQADILMVFDPDTVGKLGPSGGSNDIVSHLHISDTYKTFASADDEST